MHSTDGYKTVAASQTVITELMIPSYSNFGGKVHGGILLSLMDKVAYVCAAKHAENYCVTASIDNVHFMEAVEVGDLVSLYASVNYVGKTSLVVGIRVVAENVKTQVIKHTNTSYFTMVAMDESHKPVPIKGLILQNQTEVRRFINAMQRNTLNKYYRQEETNMKAGFNEDEFSEDMKSQHCIIDIK